MDTPLSEFRQDSIMANTDTVYSLDEERPYTETFERFYQHPHDIWTYPPQFSQSTDLATSFWTNSVDNRISFQPAGDEPNLSQPWLPHNSEPNQLPAGFNSVLSENELAALGQWMSDMPVVPADLILSSAPEPPEHLPSSSTTICADYWSTEKSLYLCSKHFADGSLSDTSLNCPLQFTSYSTFGLLPATTSWSDVVEATEKPFFAPNFDFASRDPEQDGTLRTSNLFPLPDWGPYDFQDIPTFHGPRAVPQIPNQRSRSLSPRPATSISPCPFLGGSRIFRRPSELKKHSKQHEKQSKRRHVCLECNKGFNYPKDLQRHRRARHVDQKHEWFCPYKKCRFGFRGFARKDKFLEHVRTVHDKSFDMADCTITRKFYQVPFPNLESDVPRGVRSRSRSPQRSKKLGFGSYKRRHSCPATMPRITPPRDSKAESRTTNESLLSETALDLVSRLKNPDYPNTLNKSETEKTTKGQKKTHSCTFAGCSSSFVNMYDLRRHQRTLHGLGDTGVEEQHYRCASDICKKPDKIWTRLDNFKQHLLKKHGEEDIQDLIRRSKRCSDDDKPDFSFVPGLKMPQKRVASSSISLQSTSKHHLSTHFGPVIIPQVELDATGLGQDQDKMGVPGHGAAGSPFTRADINTPFFNLDPIPPSNKRHLWMNGTNSDPLANLPGFDNAAFTL